MKNLIRRWLFPDWTPQPQKGWVLVDKQVCRSVFDMSVKAGYTYWKGIPTDDFRYKVIYTFRNVDTGEYKIEERWSQ